ncbi:MAG: GNAT family N-acetyltransferase [Chitinophagaceae bacterium]|nr:GNAT family N-acetyltransferase [Chitinophagaceae bacterium]
MVRLQFDPFPEIRTARLRLRKVTTADAHEMFFLRSDAEVQRFVDRPRAVSVEDAVRYIDDMNHLIAKNEVILWGISLVPDDKMIGYICLFHVDRANARCEVGYVLHTAYHRKGIMKEALAAVVDYGFKTIRFHTITADINPQNIASIALLRSLGFVQEAYFKENCFFNGKFLDTAIFTKINRG